MQKSVKRSTLYSYILAAFYLPQESWSFEATHQLWDHLGRNWGSFEVLLGSKEVGLYVVITGATAHEATRRIESLNLGTLKWWDRIQMYLHQGFTFTVEPDTGEYSTGICLKCPVFVTVHVKLQLLDLHLFDSWRCWRVYSVMAWGTRCFGWGRSWCWDPGFWLVASLHSSHHHKQEQEVRTTAVWHVVTSSSRKVMEKS